MFCNQSRFDLPTAIVTAAIFNQLVDSAQTRWLTTQHRKLREALPSILEGDQDLLNQWAKDGKVTAWLTFETKGLLEIRRELYSLTSEIDKCFVINEASVCQLK